ncbi:hypothetical protein BBK36DRAFT_1141626 [Trichoderma citrinoviride]|uniref:Uncharacterized protein n=1 Tax=Trichoderma citrinoviride TaxID=58853 RepID=A0A2T4B8M1_9HYPO|nr:hypothetical protein BBK36DRAFT_1141626 [Trichoderma citrinoviride]PTB65676.1 hypothetical protein BBK36DRAFT_1141626 [Trichoderma citrinoviride]
MEHSLHGFSFRPQTSLLVSDRHEIDDAEIEPMQWQEPQQHEPHLSYFEEATQTPNWEYQNQRADTTTASQTYEGHERQSGPTASNMAHVDFVRAEDEVNAYQTDHCVPLEWSRFPTVQPIQLKQEEDVDESMELIAETSPSGADNVWLKKYPALFSPQYIERKSDFDPTRIAMLDSCEDEDIESEDDEDAECEMVVDEDSLDVQDGVLPDYEDDFLYDEPHGWIRQRLYDPRSEADMGE